MVGRQISPAYKWQGGAAAPPQLPANEHSDVRGLGNQTCVSMSNQLDFFGPATPANTPAGRVEVSPAQGRLHAAATALAARGIFIGTSSWKYPGWCGLLYSADRYTTRGRLAETKFNRECLAEYAETFKSVCVDGAYYQFPSERYLTGLAGQVPADFKFSFKVTDEITLRQFPQTEPMGSRAGKANPHFLDADLFTRNFLGPCQSIRHNVGLLMFEFSRFHPLDFRHPDDFAVALDVFLGRLPRGWDYGVEIRNEEFLGRAYLDVLRQHGVAHVFNSWDAMPPVAEQMATVGDALDGLHLGARFLLTPGRSFQKAVEKFTPYTKVLEVYEPGRSAAAALIELALRKRSHLYLYGNNRLEGCSPLTLLAVIERLPKELWSDAKM